MNIAPMTVERARRGLEATKQAARDLPVETNYWRLRIQYWENALAEAVRYEKKHDKEATTRAENSGPQLSVS